MSEEAETLAGLGDADPAEVGLAGSATYDVEVPGRRQPVRVTDVDTIEVLRGGALVLAGADGGWLALFAAGQWTAAIAAMPEGEAEDAA
jgi:hypothetical protein